MIGRKRLVVTRVDTLDADSGVPCGMTEVGLLHPLEGYHLSGGKETLMTVTTHLDSGPRDARPLCGGDSSTVSNDIDDVTCGQCETAHDLTSQTPAEIDTALAEIYGRIEKAQFEVATTERHLQQYEKGNAKREAGSFSYSAFTPQKVAEWTAKVAAAKAVLHEIKAETAPYDAEFDRRGGWTRAFLVLNTGGHIHSSMECATCFWNTRFGWLPTLSGHDEAEIVEKAGSDACTVCFPSAPVIAKPRSVFHATEIEAQQAREQRAAEKAEREAKKAAKAIGPLRVLSGYPTRIETLHAAKAWLTDSQESVSRKPSDADIALVAEAIAKKLGTSVEAEIAAAAKRAAKRA